MASRPVYIPDYSTELLVETKFVDFVWHPGMAPIQRKKSVSALHYAAKELAICRHPLEVSTKSLDELGVQLSAFNLSCKTAKREREFTVETAYQSSKIFANGGPFKDLLYGTSLAAKKDHRLKESGDLVGFQFFGENWSIQPTTAFYDWVYLNALHKNRWAVEHLDNFDAFTDIEFNPQKSVNCQAYSVALFKSLLGRGLLNDALESKEAFLQIISKRAVNNASENTLFQARLI